MDESTLFDQLPAYVLGTLSQEERVQVESLLATSEEARTEVQRYEEMFAVLGTMAPARKAPSHLTEDFRQRLARSGDVPAAMPTAPTITRAAPTSQPRAIPRLSTTRLVMGLAALIVVGVAIVAIYQGIVEPQRRQQQIQAILNNPAAVRVALNVQPGGSGQVSFVMVPNSTQAVLEADQLPALPPEKQYQLWLIDTQPHGNAAFSVDQQQYRLLISMPATPDSYQKLGITVEPRGGSQKPTTTPIFLVDLPQ
jgi:anti-sigma-K factor RskA